MARKLKRFSARCLFEHERDDRTLYEERIVLIEAVDHDEAILLGEKEALQYARDNNCRYLEYIDVYAMPSPEITPGTELYSLMRESDLEADDYVTAFFDTGKERAAQSANPKYDKEYLHEIMMGIEPMTRTLAKHLLHQWELSDQVFDAYVFRMTDSELGNAEAYQLGKALVRKASTFLNEGTQS